jgi:hypothetical protein
MRSGSCVVFNGTRAGNFIPQRRVPAVYLNPCNLPNLAFLACIKINKLRRINRAYGFESNPFGACYPIGRPPEWVLTEN